jgi:hypothetical protein
MTKIRDMMNRFSFAQMTSNADGKTSSSGTMGVYIIVMSVLAFIYGCFEFHYSGKADIMMYSSANILVGAGLLGYRKSVDKTSIENGQDPSMKADHPVDKPETTPDV